MNFNFFCVLVVFKLASAIPNFGQGLARDKAMHPHFHNRLRRSLPEEKPENYPRFWRRGAQNTLQEKLAQRINQNVAKNVIIFLGDGMSIPTISAARVYIGGENKKLAFDNFPVTGLSKTYCVDKQVPDSACTATAYLCGIKNNLGTLGVTGSVERKNCSAMMNKNYHVDSIARWSQLAGKKTGFVTTTRVTHASPAGLYAHTAERDWESDADVTEDDEDPEECPDIAKQLIFGATGKEFNVIMGGGRKGFLPKNIENIQGNGLRLDGLNLIDHWLDSKTSLSNHSYYISNRSELLNLDENTENLLGLFNDCHIDYNVDRDPELTPSLLEMTQAAIRILDNSENGYFLFVEGGRIDTAHHDTMAHKALNETSEFSKAIQAAVDMTSEEDTLILVTSDHAHTMSFSGYPERGNDILGIAGQADDKLPFSTLNYANGPSYKKPSNGVRYDMSNDIMNEVNYQFPSSVPMAYETHGGDDVAIFAKGPWAHFFTGVLEENVIPHIAAYASCVGTGATACEFQKKP